MRISTLRRYPVKSMLGEEVEETRLRPSGLEHDRELALIDSATGLVATAKHPRLWRDLLKFSATANGATTMITAPGGWTGYTDDPGVDEFLSGELGRTVRLATERPDAATVERPSPEDVLDQGVEAEVPAATLQIGQGTPGTTFVDYAPVHLISSATLDRLDTEYIRYRPNFIIETPPGTEPFVENDWVGKELHVGGPNGAVLRMVLPTPRCSVPTLEHGALSRAAHPVRRLMTENRVDVPGFGELPCAGCYAEILQAGPVHTGDRVEVR